MHAGVQASYSWFNVFTSFPQPAVVASVISSSVMIVISSVARIQVRRPSWRWRSFALDGRCRLRTPPLHWCPRSRPISTSGVPVLVVSIPVTSRAVSIAVIAIIVTISSSIIVAVPSSVPAVVVTSFPLSCTISPLPLRPSSFSFSLLFFSSCFFFRPCCGAFLLAQP